VVKDDHVRLEPENDELEAIVSNEVSIVGSVVGVFRRVS
jgi:SOS-response transcriptional repressor LexA